MTIQELSKSEFAVMFNIHIEADRLRMPAPNYVSLPTDKTEITQDLDYLTLAYTGKYSLTLYKTSRTFHLVII